jgi:secondary thiamine-phosphate synthase enzyme
MHEFQIQTPRRNCFVEITREVQEQIEARGLTSGIAVVYVPHTTAAVTINENADPDVVHDMLLYLEKAIPQHQPGFQHAEGNSDSHIKASLVGSSVTVIVNFGQMQLGTWQGIWFCEFDGPRIRTVQIQLIGTFSV